MRRAVLAVLLLGVGCSGRRDDAIPPPEPAPPAPAPPSAEAKPAPAFDFRAAEVPPLGPLPVGPEAEPDEARLLVVRERELTIVGIRGGGPYPRLVAALPGGLESHAWLGDAFYLAVSDDERRQRAVLRVAQGKVEPVPLPPERVWTSRPSRPELEPVDMTRLAATEHELWLGRCQWGGGEDGGWCDAWVYARLVPPAQRPLMRSDDPRGPLGPRADAQAPASPFPPSPPAPGFSLTKAEYEFPTDPEAPPWSSSQVTRLHCRGPHRESVWPPDRGDGSFVGVTAMTWVSRDPPLYVATYEYAGLDVSSTAVLFEACFPEPHLDGIHAFELGPGGYWMVHDFGTGVAVFRGGALVARFPDASLATFAR